MINELHAARNEAVKLKGQFDGLDQEKKSLAGQVESQYATLAEVQGKLSEAETHLTAAMDQVAALQTAKKDLESRLTTISGMSSTMRRKIGFYECRDTVNMDYSSVIAASSRVFDKSSAENFHG